jgi:hypothetical protein
MFVNERQNSRTIDYGRNAQIRLVSGGPDAMLFWILEWCNRIIPFITGLELSTPVRRMEDYCRL